MKLSKRVLTGLIGIILLVGTACGGAKTATGASSSSKDSVSAESKTGQEAHEAVKADLEVAEQVAAESVAKTVKPLVGKQPFGQPSAVETRKPVKGEAAQFEDALLQVLPALRQSVLEGVR